MKYVRIWLKTKPLHIKEPVRGIENSMYKNIKFLKDT